MKMRIPKRKPRIITYQKYKHFRDELFFTYLHHEVEKQRAFLYENGLDAFLRICSDLEKHVPRKKKIFVSESQTFH